MAQVVVIGGGIAGVAVTAELARRGREVLLLEREPQLGTQSSGRSAAIYRLAVAEEVNVRLALRAREIGRRVAPGGTVHETGGLYPCANDEERRAILSASAPAGVREAIASDFPSQLAVRDGPALFSPQDGAIDTHRLVHGLAAEARAAGARFLFGSEMTALATQGGRVAGVIADGEEIRAEVVVDATGAWSPSIAPESGSGVAPARRHLFLLDTPHAANWPGVVWDLTEHIYLRPESGGLLVSPCDEQAMAAVSHVPTSTEAASLLFEKLSRWAPGLADATVRRFWAGLRPLTDDHRFVVGEDPNIPGLVRLGGFGGHGMTAGAAAGELAAELICGIESPWLRELSPARGGIA